jgi:hypothetical protein
MLDHQPRSLHLPNHLCLGNTYVDNQRGRIEGGGRIATEPVEIGHHQRAQREDGQRKRGHLL